MCCVENAAQTALESRQHIASCQDVSRPREGFNAVRPINVDLLEFPIHQPDQSRAMFKVQVELAVDLPHAVTRREDLNYQVGRAIEKFVRCNQNLLEPSLADKGYVRAKENLLGKTQHGAAVVKLA